MRQSLCFAVVLACFAVAPASSPRAASSYDNCIGYVRSVPAVITTQGVWCMDGDVSTALTDGIAVQIAVNNVIFDCNDFKLGGLAGGEGTTLRGIVAANRTNATVRNCNVRGFIKGIELNGDGARVENNRVEASRATGIEVIGNDGLVKGNLVVDSGGSPLDVNGTGIQATLRVDVIDNTISGVIANQGTGTSAYGILTSAGDGVIEGNRIRGLDADLGGSAFGIHNLGNGRIVLRDNIVQSDGSGDIGIRCAFADGRAVDNVIVGFATGVQTCFDGGNDVE